MSQNRTEWKRACRPMIPLLQRRCPMFEKVGRIAEGLAGSVSRRQFLGRLGGGALALAAAVGGLVAIPGGAQAGRGGVLCGADSSGACSGLKTGDACYDQGTGKCHAIR